MRQGEVYAASASPLTGERELRVIISGDMYNEVPTPTVVTAEIELGTRYRDSALALSTDFGLVLLDRLVWVPRTELGEYLGRLKPEELRRAVDLVCALVRNG